ncbi:hypothetical protein LTR56_021997 [Elasticomyces elasticus]|nr:hypothetical protein LTR56_021997 [Elasticomyces elasticus]KAK4920159.1 hypothetical protein LTR49_012258 [Elasticomyces elasticus]
MRESMGDLSCAQVLGPGRHQNQIEAVHKSICVSTLAEELNEDLRPSPHHRRAILLPEVGERPKFVWIHDASSSVSLGDAIGVTACFDLTDLVRGGTGEGIHIDHDINVRFKDEMQIDGVSKNNSVISMLTKGITNDYWKGPLVVCGTLKDDVIENLSTLVNYRVDLYPCDIGLAVKALARKAKTKEVGGFRFEHVER